jgi:hypothetical protein
MKTQTPPEPNPTFEERAFFGDSGPWANGWQPAWDSAKSRSNGRAEPQGNPQDPMLEAGSQHASGTPAK